MGHSVSVGLRGECEFVWESWGAESYSRWYHLSLYHIVTAVPTRAHLIQSNFVLAFMCFPVMGSHSMFVSSEF